jgi:alcohol dehydrogenase (cytochrome c)
MRSTKQFNGGGFRSVPGEQDWGAIRAFDPATGNLKWEHKLFSAPWAGLLSTAGNLVFGGTNEGQVFALQASTGKLLWRFQAGGSARSNPISYSVGGKQYVAVTVGNALYVFGLEAQ